MKVEDKYTVVDVETPNKMNNSLCSIALINIENKKKKEEYYLVNPEAPFDDINIRIHHITPSMVEGKENFEEVWQKIKQYFSYGIIIAHNARFDLNVICKALDSYNIEIPIIYYIDTLEVYRKEFPNLMSYKLNELSEIFNIELKDHHNAKSDTKACFDLFNLLIKKGVNLDDYVRKYDYIHKDNKRASLSIEKNINNLYGIINGIVADKEINAKEILELK